METAGLLILRLHSVGRSTSLDASTPKRRGGDSTPDGISGRVTLPKGVRVTCENPQPQFPFPPHAEVPAALRGSHPLSGVGRKFRVLPSEFLQMPERLPGCRRVAGAPCSGDLRSRAPPSYLPTVVKGHNGRGRQSCLERTRRARSSP